MAAVGRTTKASELYYVASTARTKLGKEACRESHRLRMLVGHANTLDYLMEELNQMKINHVDDEQRQAQRGVRGPEEIPELEDDSSSDDDSDDLSEPDEDDDKLVLVRCPVKPRAQAKPAAAVGLRPQPIPQPQANPATCVVTKPTSKSGYKSQASIPSSAAEKSGRRQRSTDRCPKPVGPDVYRKR